MCGLHILKGNTGADFISQGRTFFFNLPNMFLMNDPLLKGAEPYFRVLNWGFPYIHHL